MTNLERREKIIEMLTENENYITATALAQSFGVTRQIIVSDIAILRAQGNKISAVKNTALINFPITRKSYAVR